MGSQPSSHLHKKLLEKVEEAYINESMEIPRTPSSPSDIVRTPHQEEKKSTTTTTGPPHQEEKKSITTTGPPHQEEKKKSSRFQSLARKLWKNLEHETDRTGETQGFLNEKQAKEFFEECYEYFKQLLQSHGTYFNPNIPKEQIISEWISSFDLNNDKKISFDEFVHSLQVLAQAVHPEFVEPNAVENPILHETFTYELFVPPNLKKFDLEESKTVGREVSKEVLPLEITGLGVEVVVDGFEGSGVRTLVQLYGGPLTPKRYAQCNRDIFNKGIPIPIKLYLHPERDNFEGEYLPVTQDYPFRFHLIVLVFDLNAPITDEFRVAVGTRISMIKKYLDQTYEQVPHPPLLFVGNKMEVVQNFNQVKKEYLVLAEKYHAMYTSMSAKTGLFVSKGFRHALSIAVGNRFGYSIH